MSCPSCGYTSPILAEGKLRAEKFPQSNRVVLHVDSRARNLATQSSSSTFSIALPEQLHNVSSAALLSAEIPLTYYAFTATRGNTSLTFKYAGTPGTVTIPDGNYTTSTMATALAAALAAAFPAAGAFTVTFSATTSRCTIAVASGTVAVDATASDGTDLATLLGFQRGVVTSGTATVTGTGAATMSPDAYLLISIDELDAAGLATTYGMAAGRAFAKIPLKNDSFLANPYDVGAPRLLAVRPPLSRLERLHVSLRFGDGTAVDLNGGEWSMTLELVGTLARTL